ncbi:MAG: flagellar basal body P-ring protein FlgI, partial [Phycisphaerales bacterium]|nr:flagellar basal body P-ring protein FlgI [Phycisphaerales bacterium]
MQNPTLRRAVPSLLLVLGVAGVLAAAGCSGSSKPRPFEAAPIVRRNVPEAFRNTIGAEATIGGIEPVLVSGYGFVVGLHGTGGQPLPEPIAATMERTLGLNGVNAANPMPGLPPMSPRDLLRHPDTAVVVVTAAIPPGAPRGTRFDVAIEAVNANSLDGGRLWTTELRLGPPSPLGGHVTQRLGTALGEVFENPFREPGSAEFTAARVLNGGVVTEPFDLIIQLDSPSHARARQIVSAVNSRFPDDDGVVTARGVDDSRIGLHVPSAYADRPDAFLNIVIHLPIDWQYRREYAQRYVRAMKDDPALARELAWCLVACNER